MVDLLNDRALSIRIQQNAKYVQPILKRNWDETKLFSQTEMHAYILQFHSTRPLLHLTIILWPTYAASIVSKTCLTIFIHAADLYFFLS